MLIVGERIHVISPAVKAAFEARDTDFIQGLAREQVAGGARILDLNIGPAKKTGLEIMPWLVRTVQDVVDVGLSLDTTNAEAMAAGLQAAKLPTMVNSASAEPQRLETMYRLAADHGSDLIALSLTEQGIPQDANGRAEVAAVLIEAAGRFGIPLGKLYLDPLTLPVSADQVSAMQTVESIRVFKCIADPAPMTIIGLSNVSNGCPKEIRGLINRVFLVMCLGAGLDAAIANPNDEDLKNWVRVVESRDESTPLGRLLIQLHDSIANMEEAFEPDYDTADQELDDVMKTVRVLQNRTLYAHSYLRS